jgi:pyruvate kinase
MPLTPNPSTIPDAARRPTLAKIVATVGPASSSPQTLRALIDAGVNVFRLNLSHGNVSDHAEALHAIREAARAADLPVAVLGDLPGPKIRVGMCPDGGLPVDERTTLLIDPARREPAAMDGGCIRIGCSYEHLAADVKPGERVLINDGVLRLRAVERAPSDPATAVRCVLDRGAPAAALLSRKGVNLPDSDLRLPSLTGRDWELVEWAVGQGVDLIAISFVRRAADVAMLQSRLAGITSATRDVDAGQPSEIPVIAKIETPQAVEAMDEIVKQADGIMIARGDLGVEMDPWDVPVIQRRLIQCADSWGKPCVVATQMLESMTNSPTPTRAEASDVATAVISHADAVMLSGETAVGRYPVETVETMNRIIHAAEAFVASRREAPSPPRHAVEDRQRSAALAHGAWYVARDVGAKLVVVWSQHGGLARFLSQTGFTIPIIAYSSSAAHTRRMALLKGVRPILGTVPDEPAAALALWNDAVDAELLRRGWAALGDTILLMAGQPLGAPKVAGTMAIHHVGNPGTGFRAHG